MSHYLSRSWISQNQNWNLLFIANIACKVADRQSCAKGVCINNPLKNSPLLNTFHFFREQKKEHEVCSRPFDLLLPCNGGKGTILLQRPPDCVGFRPGWNSSKTAFQYNHSFGFQKPMKVKVVNWGRKKWNKHDLMHIYHKPWEIIQKIEWNSSNGQIHCFHYVQ